jgi:hypothetical protein
MIRASWSTILEGLDGALDLCRSLGLGDHLEGRRFDEHRRHLQHLVEALKAGGQQGALVAFEADRLKSIGALTESAEIADLLPFLETVPRATLANKLVHVLGGPVLATDETFNSNQARNILFELNLASKLWNAGLAPELGEHPDLTIQIASSPILIQCKRPFSPTGARRALRDAKDQLSEDLSGSSVGSRGVIGLSLSRLLNPGDQIFRYQSEADARKALADQLETETYELLSAWGGPGKDIIGILCHVITPGVDDSARLWMMIQQMIIHPFAPPGSPDEELFRLINDALAENRY